MRPLLSGYCATVKILRNGLVMIKAMKDPSPLVRGAAAESLTNTPSPQTTGALLEATGDGYRLFASGRLWCLPLIRLSLEG